MKPSRRVFLNLFIICLLIILFFIAYEFFSKSEPNISTIHVINLDKDVVRWNSIASRSQNVLPRVERFPAIWGKDIDFTSTHPLGIGYAMTNKGTGSYAEQSKDLRNIGTVGCFLSHRNLMTQLSKIRVGNNAGHLILEDDVVIPDNFLGPGTRWHSVKKEIPSNWDIVYLGMNDPIGSMISPNIMKLRQHSENIGNWGAHAYLVKHGSLKKILSWLAYMVDAVDGQLSMKFDEWNVYCIKPYIINLDEVLVKNSSITTL